MRGNFRGIFLSGLIFFFTLNIANAGDATEAGGLIITPWSEGWSVGAHGGQAVKNSVEDLGAFLPYQWDMLDYYIVSVGVRKKIFNYDKYFSVYTELNASYISGEENYGEVFLTPTISWDLFPWDEYVDTSASIGLGLSYASNASDLDATKQKLLASMIFELEFTLPDYNRWSLYTRVHHRSGAYGTFDRDGGSNFPSIGLRYHFN